MPLLFHETRNAAFGVESRASANKKKITTVAYVWFDNSTDPFRAAYFVQKCSLKRLGFNVLRLESHIFPNLAPYPSSEILGTHAWAAQRSHVTWISTSGDHVTPGKLYCCALLIAANCRRFLQSWPARKSCCHSCLARRPTMTSLPVATSTACRSSLKSWQRHLSAEWWSAVWTRAAIGPVGASSLQAPAPVSRRSTCEQLSWVHLVPRRCSTLPFSRLTHAMPHIQHAIKWRN